MATPAVDIKLRAAAVEQSPRARGEQQATKIDPIARISDLDLGEVGKMLADREQQKRLRTQSSREATTHTRSLEPTGGWGSWIVRFENCVS